MNVFIVVCGLVIHVVSGETCPSGYKTNTFSLFGTKTGYENVGNYNYSTLRSRECFPKSIWMFIRHGTRNPGDDLIEDMHTKLKQINEKILKSAAEGRGTLCKDGLNALENWKFDLTKNQQKLLTPEGEVEMSALGSRWKQRLGADFDKFLPGQFKVRHTPTERTKYSAENFLHGFFGAKMSQINMSEVDNGDPVLRGYKTCDRWIQEVKNNNKTFAQTRKFYTGPEMKAVVTKVQERTGVEDLSTDEMHLMYQMLSYEEAWVSGSDSPSPWRSMFSEDDLKVVQYLDDLDMYYQNGYYDDLTAKVACATLQDLIETFKSSADATRGTFYFSHSGAIVKLLVRLGLFRPKAAPTASNFDHVHLRTWNSGRIDPFGSNVAAVLFDCGPNPSRVQLFVNENPVEMPGCGTMQCPLEDFERLASSSYECNMADICQPASSSPPTAHLSWIVLLCLLFLLI